MVVVVLRRIHARRNRPYLHRLRGGGVKQVWPVRIEGEPPAVVFRPEDRRHAVVNTPDELVRRRGDDGEGSDPLAGGRVLPVLPKGGKTERRAVLHRNSVGLLHLRASDRHPKPSIGTMQRRLRYASRNIGSRSTVSALALMGGGFGLSLH